MLLIFRSLTLIAILMWGHVNAASIKQLFSAYQEHLQNGEDLMALDKIEQAFELSENKNGPESPTTLALMLNYVQLYIAQRDMNPDYKAPRAMGLLNEYLDYQIDNKGKGAVELIDPLMALGTAHLWHESPLREGQREFRDRVRRFGGDRTVRSAAIRDGRFKAITQFKKAITIAQTNKSDYPLLAADLQFEAAKELFNRGIEAEQGQEFLLSAHETYSAQLANTDARVILSAFWSAQVLAFAEKFSASNRYYQKVISGYQAAGLPSHNKAIESYRALIENYEFLGLSEQATPYIQDLGRLLPWFKVRERVPLFQPAIEITKADDQQSAEGRFLLTIDTEGKVGEVKLVDFRGDDALQTVMISALKKRRYAPRYRDGLLIESQTQATLSIQ